MSINFIHLLTVVCLLVGNNLALARSHSVDRGSHGYEYNHIVPGKKLEKLFRKQVALPITAKQKIAQFRQLEIELDGGRIEGSDWGKLSINRAKLFKHFGNSPSYINAFFSADRRSGRILWGVRNLYLAGNSSSRKRHAGRVSAYIDLRPDEVNGRGEIKSLDMIVVISRSPLPFVSASLDFIERKFKPGSFKVTIEKENIGGDLGEIIDPRPTPIDNLSIGYPPQPDSPPYEPQFDLATAVAIYQTSSPNIQAAKNQCVPMAHANVVQFLENKTNILPLQWPLPELPIPGIGEIVNFGDVFYWSPNPDNSVIANIDAKTTRAGVFDPDSGSGSNRCQNIRGVMSYLRQNNLSAEFHHQGGAERYGFNGSCDSNPPFSDVGELYSEREGIAPTWQWIFDQLVLGRGVSLSYGRYDFDGARTGGHMLRVWGASELNGERYLHLLHDSNQGSNNSGLELIQFRVEDTGQPGFSGVPDGRLNINGGSSEIEFALSIKAQPTLLLP